METVLLLIINIIIINNYKIIIIIFLLFSFEGVSIRVLLRRSWTKTLFP